MVSALELLTWYEHEGFDFLKYIVMEDESWFHCWTPECKEKSRVWKTGEKKAPCKFKEQPSVGKIFSTMFWDYQGVIMIEYSPPGRTGFANAYSDTLMRLQQAIKEKRHGLLLERVVQMHGNAQPHTVMFTISLLADFKWDIFPHPHIPSAQPLLWCLPPYYWSTSSGTYSLIPIFPQSRTGGLLFVPGNQTRAWLLLIRNRCGTACCDHWDYRLFRGKLVYSRNRRTCVLLQKNARLFWWLCRKIVNFLENKMHFVWSLSFLVFEI